MLEVVQLLVMLGLDIAIHMIWEGRQDGEKEEIPGANEIKQLRVEHSNNKKKERSEPRL